MGLSQGKGTSEQHPSLSPADEFADFEIWDKGNLKQGLQVEEKYGTNPFKFGFVGSTDAHDRQPDANGKLLAVGNTGDVKNATWTNTIGAPELIAVWRDPDFNPALKAFYYVRVLEIPTPRWTAYDAAFFEDSNFAPEVPFFLQERAYTSAIWYAP